MSSKRILVAPLDWGLGHASRCIPLIRVLLQKGCEVVIAADKGPLALLRHEFPQLKYVVLPGYGITYPKNGSMMFRMLISVPKILKGIRREHRQLEKIIAQERIDAVISDNRFGLWSSQVPAVFITHQLLIRSPFGEGLLHQLNKRYINRYTRCWIPDVADEMNLSGDLSHRCRLPENARFIGPLSRFSGSKITDQESGPLVLLSGPEPQRSLLEEKLLSEIGRCDISATIVRGLASDKKEIRLKGKVTLINFLSAAELEPLLQSSQCIIARPGYSTIMDLAALGRKNLIFIPTPGQTEQEYLAGLLTKKGIAYCVSQQDLDLQKALSESEGFSGFKKMQNGGALENAVEEFLALL